MCQTNNHKRKRADKADGMVRRTLNKYGYPPDKQQQAVKTVMKQAEILTDKWAIS